MKKIIFLLAVLGLTTAAFAGGKKDKSSPADAETAEISALGAIGGIDTALKQPLFEGEDGEGSRLVILSPRGKGAAEDALLSPQDRGGVQDRKSWLATFKEAATFFNNHPPFEIIFDPRLIQEGSVDSVNEWVDLAMRVALEPADADFEALSALVQELDKTDKREAWGFNGWPLLDIEPKTPDAVVFGGKREFSFKVDVALMNEKKKVIARGSINLESGSISYSAGDSLITPPAGDANLVYFPKVNANDLTPALTIAITGVNGRMAKRLNDSGYITIAVGSLEEKTRAIEEAWKAATVFADMVLVQAGTFQMGGTMFDDEMPVHTVMISKSYYIGKHEVTQKEWAEVMGSNPSSFQGDNLPVENVSWLEVIDYCNKRSVKEGLTPAYTVSGSTVTWNENADGYRLPTEAEWEFAARGGVKGAGYKYAGSSNAGDAGWWYDRKGGNKTHPVGTKQANELWLYDMSGNVWEWCWDRYGNYSSEAQADPAGTSSGARRVIRGGSGFSYTWCMRPAYRSSGAPTNRDSYLGFRLVRS